MLGEIEGVPEGSWFPNRQALHDAGIHGGVQQGIGARGESIVLSGGYIDDIDQGDVILYTGQGGRDPNTGRQIKDQELKRGNLALETNYRMGNPIRVCRGTTSEGYRYDGLFRIDSFWSELGVDGYKVFRYRLVKIPHSELIDAGPIDPHSPRGTESSRRSTVYTTRVIRNSKVGSHVKDIHDFRCQISGDRLSTPDGPYAEACHIRPVGSPHNGPDIVDNVLCLSPNMHVLFDMGAIGIADDFKLLGIEGQLRLHPGHTISLNAIRYHRDHIFRGRK